MRNRRLRHLVPGAHPGYVGSHQARRRGGVVRLSEWKGNRRVGHRDGRVTLLDAKWREITSDYRVAESGSNVEVEILALALGLDQAMFIEPPVVTAA